MARGHHHKRGAVDDMPEDHDGKPMSYTAENNVEGEAEGERRKRGGKVKRERGGHVAKHHVEHHQPEEVHHHHYRRGGTVAKKEAEMEGHKTKHRRLDRPGRKRGGGVGADMTPLSTAARTRQTGHMADNDDLAE